MVLKFMTRENTYGTRNYLTFDTIKRTFTTNPLFDEPEDDRIEVKKSELKDLIWRVGANGYEQKEAV